MASAPRDIPAKAAASAATDFQGSQSFSAGGSWLGARSHVLCALALRVKRAQRTRTCFIGALQVSCLGAAARVTHEHSLGRELSHHISLGGAHKAHDLLAARASSLDARRLNFLQRGYVDLVKEPVLRNTEADAVSVCPAHRHSRRRNTRGAWSRRLAGALACLSGQRRRRHQLIAQHKLLRPAKHRRKRQRLRHQRQRRSGEVWTGQRLQE